MLNCRNCRGLHVLIFQPIYWPWPSRRRTDLTGFRQEMMLDGLRQFIADVVSPTAHADRDVRRYRISSGGDGAVGSRHLARRRADPRSKSANLHSLIESRFGLDPGTADQLIASATLVEGEAVDLYHFTSVIMRSVNEEGRLRIVEMMWELALRRRPGQRIRGQRGLARGRSPGSVLARPDRSQASCRRQAIQAGRRQLGYRRCGHVTRCGSERFTPPEARYRT